jgi:peptide/nickel transport system substrate-binding protein
MPASALAFLLVAGLGAIDLAAQNPNKKPPPVEEEDRNAGKPKRRIDVEDEDPTPPKSKVPIPVDDDKPTKPVPPPVTIDLAAAAKQAKHPALRTLYHEISVPHDAVTFKSLGAQAGRVEYVEPLKEYYAGANPQFKGTLALKALNREDWKPLAKKTEAPQNSAQLIEPYEFLALAAIRKLEDGKYDQLTETDKKYLSRTQILEASESVLLAVLRFHETARESNKRVDGDWDSVIARVRAKLLDVHQEQLAQIAATNNWEATFVLARRSSESYSRPEDREKLARSLVELALKPLESANPSDAELREGQRRFALIEDVLPGSAVAGPLGATLRQRAENLFERAKKLQEQHQEKQALELIALADAIWPRLAGLHDMHLKLSNTYPILRVGVAELPTSFLPGLAASDSEKQAVELLFESLVQSVRDGSGGHAYAPVLAAAPPILVPLGRQFQIARSSNWSNDKPVNAKDIAHTVELLKDPKWPGYLPESADFYGEVQQVGGDPARIRVELKRGLFDPLSLMTFKVLPRDVTPNNIARFNAKPIGSGPYKLGEPIVGEDGRKAIVFVANPSYSSRAGKSQLPRIREIHFLQTDDPVKEFDKGDDKRTIDLYLGVNAEQAKSLRSVSSLTVSEPMVNRRIYFLAVNHQRPALKNDSLRQALTYAVNREKILDDCFRGDLGKKVHRALNGPYPAGSWACDPNLGSLDRLDKAKHFADQAGAEGYKDLKLGLLYPKNDAPAAKAMAMVRDAMKEIGVEIDLQPLDLASLREAVEKTQNFDLAYYRYDYSSEVYWLKPLFEPGGKYNYMNIPADSLLDHLFGEALSHRQFSEVQTSTRSIHGLFQTQMPFIPLWQLDAQAAYHKSLKPGPMDPLLLFPGIEEWRMERAEKR